ncbi:MAG: DUF481 domain-containing protein [Bacteroidota bacterium]
MKTLRPTATYLLIGVLVLLSQLAAAQIVNIEDKRVERQDTAGWYGFINAGLTLVNNGSEIITINGALRVERLQYRHWFMSLSNFNLVKAEGKDFVNNGFQHFRYNYNVNKWLTWEAFVQAQYDERLNLRLRTLLGTGPRFRLFRNDKIRAFLGTLYMYEYNRETDPEVILNDNRLSTYLSFNYKPLSNVTIASTTYYQPLLNKLADWRLSSQSSLLIAINSKLRFKASFNIIYDSKVPEGVANTIYRLTNGIRLDF